jgi:hypothetical protein
MYFNHLSVFPSWCSISFKLPLQPGEMAAAAVIMSLP